MFKGAEVVAAFKECGVTHVIWIPDSSIGAWEAAICADKSIQLIRVCRESEAMAIAGGLMLGGKQPIVLIQCTGLFDAGDALRNVVHDLKLPLFLIIGLRSYYDYQKKTTADTCPVFTEPIMRAWQIPFALLDDRSSVSDLKAAYRLARSEHRAGAVLIAE